MELTELQLNRNLYKTQPQTPETLGADEVASNLAPPPSTAIASGNSVTDINTNSETINGSQLTPGTVPQTTLDIANWGWTQTSAFSVTDSDTVAWGAGVFTSADGTSVYIIGAGNTGNMVAKTYIYLDINVSTTAYQITTSVTTPIGIGKVLIAVAQNGPGTATFVLVQATQVVADNIIANTIVAEKLSIAQLSAITADLGAITAGTITVVGGGNTVAFTPALTNVIISGPTGSPNFFLTNTGYLTSIGMSSLNKSAYTNFETSTRFVNTQTGSASAPSFGNQGVTVSTSATATSSSLLQWRIGNVYTNNPTFTCTINLLTVGPGDARCFVGLGSPTVNGSGITYTGNSYIGFSIDKSSGVVTVSSEINNGSGSPTGASIFSPVQGDVIELFIRVTSAAVFWYYRVNGGALVLGDTQTTHIPTGSGEDSVLFAASNAGSANNFQMIMQCAGYEH